MLAFNPEIMQPVCHLPAFESDNLKMRELDFIYKLLIRGHKKAPEFQQAVQTALGMALPENSRNPVTVEENILFEMTPDEWLLRLPSQSELQSRQQALIQALSGQHTALVEVSDYYTIFRIEGEQLPILLQKNSSFDFHETKFLPGQAITTRYSHCTIHVHALTHQSFDIQIRGSHASYLWAMLMNSALGAKITLEKF